MSKQKKTFYSIFFESIGLYFSHFNKFIKYMTFPILGQVFGLGLILLISQIYSANLPKIIEKYPSFNNLSTLVLVTFIITLPGLAIFCKAFWEYLIAYGSINSMYANLAKSGRIYDFDAHRELIKRRTASFVGLWLLISIFSLLAICPFFTLICAIFTVYFVLIFQVFVFEPELSPFGCARKSLILIKGHFAQTFILITLSLILTYFLIPNVLTKGLEILGFNDILSNLIMPLLTSFPEIDLELYGIGNFNHSSIAMFIIQITLAQIFIQYTLPMRSILWSLWYKELNGDISQTTVHSSTKKTKTSKRPSEKLMEESHKKYSKKKLDDNILRRAMEKDEDE